MNFIKRICKWNEQRYKQEFVLPLTVSLLKEEVNELETAPNKVEVLDALGDIVYVAIGAMWKMGLSPREIEKAISAICDSNDTKSVVKTPSHIKANKDKGQHFVPPTECLKHILADK